MLMLVQRDTFRTAFAAIWIRIGKHRRLAD